MISMNRMNPSRWDFLHYLIPEADTPPHPAIWINYFRRMVQLYSGKVCDLQMASNEEDVAASLSFLKGKEKERMRLLIMDYKGEFTPIEVSRKLSVTNEAIINRLAVMV